MQTQKINLLDPTAHSECFLIPASGQTDPSNCNNPIPIGEFFTIGRQEGTHLKLDDPFVSHRHARIERKNGSLVIRDMQSRNGTFLNGSRVSEAFLTSNDLLRFGESTFVFTDSQADPTTLSSRNQLWNEQLSRLPNLAKTDFSVLITGPSGTGKEILARTIHRQSMRARNQFISINCSALSESLIESELFGHIRGSYTGATHDRKGAFESARGGTLFLDEIGDLPLSLQPKLLRAIENNEIRPVGSDRAIETDVRILAATHKNLAEQVRSKRFREDLFYRLNVCQIRPPALIDRSEDFEHLIYAFAKQMRVRFSFGAIERLKKHSWPGNIRELKNVVSRAAAYMPGKHIQPEDIESLLDIAEPSQTHYEPSPAYHYPDVSCVTGGINPSGNRVKEVERDLILRSLTANLGNQRRTAKDLGMPKSTLHDRIRAYRIDYAKEIEPLRSKNPEGE
jgi:DNA-binding NtrC family response regulator